MPQQRKHPDLRARQNQPAGAKGPDLKPVAQPELPGELADIEAVVTWWAALGRDPRAEFMTELDWLDAIETGMVVADFHENANIDRSVELRNRKDRLEKRLRELGELAALKQKRTAQPTSSTAVVPSARDRLKVV